MKIAIPVFDGKVSPRFDLSPELWIITEKEGKISRQEIFPLEGLSIAQRMGKLTSHNVNKVICGGIHDFTLNQLLNMGIDVFHNVIGKAETALTLFLRGELQSGFCCDKRKGNESRE